MSSSKKGEEAMGMVRGIWDYGNRDSFSANFRSKLEFTEVSICHILLKTE